MLKNLANLLNERIISFSVIYHKNFISVVEQKEFAEKGIFISPLRNGSRSPYIFPEGEVVPEKCGKSLLNRTLD